MYIRTYGNIVNLVVYFIPCVMFFFPDQVYSTVLNLNHYRIKAYNHGIENVSIVTRVVLLMHIIMIVV